MFPEQPVPKDVNELKNQSVSNPSADDASASQTSTKLPQPVQQQVQDQQDEVKSPPQAFSAHESSQTGNVFTESENQFQTSTPTNSQTLSSEHDSPVQSEQPLEVQSPVAPPEEKQKLSETSAPSNQGNSQDVSTVATQGFTPAPEPNVIKVTPTIPPLQQDTNLGKKRRKFSINVVGLLLKLTFTAVFVSPFLAGGLVALISYDFISIGNPLLQRKIQNMFFSLPYFPKPTRYVLESALENQKSIKSAALDATFEISDVDKLTQGLILPQNSNITLNGYYDVKIPNARKYKLQTDILGVFDIEFLNTGDRSYVNPKSLPDEVFDYLQLLDSKQRNSILDMWIDLGPQVSKDTTVEEEQYTEYLTLLSTKLYSRVKSSSDDELFKYELSLDKASIQEMLSFLEDYYKKQGEDVKAVNIRDLYEENKNIESITLVAYIGKLDLQFINLIAEVKTKVNLSTLNNLPIESFIPENFDSAGYSDLSLKVDIKQKDINKDFDFAAPSDSKTLQDYITYVTQVSPLFGMQTARIEYVSVLSVLETFKQEMLAYYLQNSIYPDNLDPLPSSASFKVMEDEQILYYRKLDLTHWGMFVAIPDPTITYPTLKSDPELGEEKTPEPTREQPYMALIFISNAADPQVQYYSVTEIGNIAGDVVLRKLGNTEVVDVPEIPKTLEEPVTPENPEEPETSNKGECDSPFGCLLN